MLLNFSNTSAAAQVAALRPPFEAGMWAMSACDSGRPQLGRVKDVHSGDVIDVVIFASDGQRIGRVSPAMGGPRGFEPCCGAELWIPIEKPDFARLGKHRYEYRDMLVPLRVA